MKSKIIGIFAVLLTFSISSVALAQESGKDTSTNVGLLLKEKSISKLDYVNTQKYQGKNIFRILNDDGSGNFTYTANNNIPKEIVLNAVDALNKKENEKMKLLDTGTSYSLIGSRNAPGPQAGYKIHTEFTTYAWVPGGIDLQDDTIEFHGNSYNSWDGNSPARGDITAADTFSYSKIGAGGSMSVTFPMGAGGTIEKTATSATLAYPPLPNEYLYYHNYSGIKGEAFNIYKASQTSAVTFLLGNATYSTFAEDTVDINN